MLKYQRRHPGIHGDAANAETDRSQHRSSYASSMIFWIAVVSEDWVRIPADAYASRLMESVELLERDAPS
jgi:hypothetical protein